MPNNHDRLDGFLHAAVYLFNLDHFLTGLSLSFFLRFAIKQKERQSTTVKNVSRFLGLE